MKKFLQKKLKNEKGLTLVELLAVVVILGIIAAIAVPAIGNIITNSKVNALKADGQNVLSAAQLYFTENSVDDNEAVTVKKLNEDGFLDDTGGFPLDDSTKVTKKADSNTIEGTAVNGKVSVKFENATNKQITAAKKGETNTNVTISTK